MRLIDSHAHLQADRFQGEADEVAVAAQLAGVERILVPGWDGASCRAAVQLAGRHAFLDAAVGVHPHHAAEVDDHAWAEIGALAVNPVVGAIGETGLDYDRAFAPREAQLANLRRNLELALRVGRPAILHCRSRLGQRDAQDELLTELRRAGVGERPWRARFGDRPPALLHSFSGPPDYAQTALELGLAISFSGLVFRPGEDASAEVARLVPTERLLVETDAPYLSPPGTPRRRNEPAHVAVTAAWLAVQRGDDPEALGRDLVANYDRIFREGR